MLLYLYKVFCIKNPVFCVGPSVLWRQKCVNSLFVYVVLSLHCISVNAAYLECFVKIHDRTPLAIFIKPLRLQEQCNRPFCSYLNWVSQLSKLDRNT